ncbi:MAG: Gfo/Idh/MocA family oxidoreductase [Gorillibacterium sp.]|nr:Gfo/Idh/MocA family oxidoreductase [Gorillibacterium sp.]
MAVIRFGIIGGGWRAEFYLRIAKALPEQFQVEGMLIRDKDKAAKMEQVWNVPTYQTLDTFLDNQSYSFIVLSVSWAASPAYLVELAQRAIPVLAETPPAPDIEALVRLYEAVGGDAKIQVAEQYLFQPLHAARISIAHSGKLGPISQAQVSAAHGYHGISLIRRLLSVQFEDAEINGQAFTSSIVNGPTRDALPSDGSTSDSNQDIAFLRFGHKLGIFDFTNDQYFSWIRKNRMLVRGSSGEIVNDEVSYLQDHLTPIYYKLSRVDTGHAGNLEGYYHRGIMGGAEWVYVNPFVGGRLSDDEVAIATSLLKMEYYVQGGPAFYSLAEASQDHYLSILVQEAIQTGMIVKSTKQIWAQKKERLE